MIKDWSIFPDGLEIWNILELLISSENNEDSVAKVDVVLRVDVNSDILVEDDVSSNNDESVEDVWFSSTSFKLDGRGGNLEAIGIGFSILVTASFKGIVLTEIWCGVSSLLVKFSKNISVESNKLTVGSVVEEVSVSGDVVGVIAFDLDELEVNIRSNKGC